MWGLRALTSSSGCLPIPALWHKGGLTLLPELPENPGLEAANEFSKDRAFCGEGGINVDRLQESQWQQLYLNPTQWWNNKRVWVLKRPCQPLLILAKSSSGRSAFEDDLVGTVSRNLCEDGQITDAVDALDLLVQRGCHVPNNLFYRVIKRCSGHKNLALGRHIHALTVKGGYEGDAFLATHLIGMYASHGRLEEALRVFAKVSTPNAHNWATIIFAHARHGKPTQAIELYERMRESRVTPDNHIFLAVLKACASAGDLGAGRKVHAHVLASAGKPDMFVQNSLVDMYAKCGSLEHAQAVFDELSHKDAVTWTAMISGYAQQGMGQEALELYLVMQLEGITAPSSATFTCLLQACTSVGGAALHQGKQLHAQIEERGLEDDVVIGGSLVSMYAKCGNIEDARKVFDRLSYKNVVTWTAMIAGYAQQEMGREALTLYSRMQQGSIANSVTFTCLLQACAGVGVAALDQGKKLHAEIKERGLQDDVVVGGSLVNMYAKCGSIEDARCVFDRLPHRNVVTWNAMLAGYAQLGMGQEALTLYRSMPEEGIAPPNSVTCSALLQACACVGVGALDQGRQLHAQIEGWGLQNDVVVGSSLVNMYAKCGNIDDARRVFDSLPYRNVVTWNAMIAGYVHEGMGQEALSSYDSMRQDGLAVPDSFTFVCLLQACASLGAPALHQGTQLHAQIEEQGLQNDVVVGGSLVNLYAKCGSVEDACRVFDGLPHKNVVAWTVMIAAYTQQRMGQEALTLYRSMLQEGLTPPDSITFVCLLQACAIVAALPLGEQLHAKIKEQGLQADVAVGTGLVNMYAKCGSMVDAQQVFDALTEKTMEAWGALIAGYTRQGDCETVFELLERMLLEGKQPNGIMLLSVLTVCSHVGLVDMGRKYFEAMSTDYGICPAMEHYTCMMDLLGRAGHLDEALQMAKTMPFRADNAVWLTLLGACRKWNNVEIGRQAFDFAVSVDEEDASAYVLMSNIYAGARMWEEAKRMQAKRVKCKAWKQPGQSWWTDMDGVVHTFVARDKKHLESDGIYARLQQLVPRLKKAGYLPHLESSLRDIPDDEKEAELWGHSEKLAIAHALNKTPEGTTIRVVKNLRVCVDCHIATAYISKLEKRTIVCRDANRFHVYKDGKCSCGDYW